MNTNEINFTDKKTLVVGLGVSGVAAAELLFSRGAHVWVTEEGSSDVLNKRASDLETKGIKVEIGGHTEEFVLGAELIVVSPGVDHNDFLKKWPLCDGIPMIGELELGYLFCESPIIAITGTNGKSTTTELIGNMFTISGRDTIVCGNIGNPLSGEIDSISTDSVTVAEVSSFQLETMKAFRPHIAILLNVAEDHYDRHGGFDAYKEVKFRIFENQEASDWAIIHHSLISDPMIGKIKGRVLFYGAGGTAAYVDAGGDIVIDLNGKKKAVLNSAQVHLQGEHNLENITCSILAAKILGLSDENIKNGIASFKALYHRFESVGIFNGIEFIDDSKATNIDATRRALESVGKKVVLIAGGVDKGGDYTAILPVVKEKVKAMVAMGEARTKISEAYMGSLPVILAENMADSIEKAVKQASDDEVVLLSPMCSSFDMYSSYKERGNDFQNKVREYFKQ